MALTPKKFSALDLVDLPWDGTERFPLVREISGGDEENYLATIDQIQTFRATALAELPDPTVVGEGAVRYVPETASLWYSTGSGWIEVGSGGGGGGGILASFMVNKGGTNQTTIPQGTATLITWSTAVYDNGGYFDLTNDKWVPPAGLALFTGKLQVVTGSTIGDKLRLQLYKNGVLYITMNIVYAAAANDNDIIFAMQDFANGTDEYQIYVNLGNGAGADKTVHGGTSITFWQGVLFDAS